jgi:hypothetical protein
VERSVGSERVHFMIVPFSCAIAIRCSESQG